MASAFALCFLKLGFWTTHIFPIYIKKDSLLLLPIVTGTFSQE